MLKITRKHEETFVTIDEVKQNLRVLNSDEDYLIETLCESACYYVQESSGKILNESEYTLTLFCAGGAINLPVYPVKSIDSISYYDATDTLQVVTVSDAGTDLGEDCATIAYDWPELSVRDDAITIVFTSGVPETINFPVNLKQAAILLASHWYENRTAAGMKLEDIPYGVETLINISKTGWY